MGKLYSLISALLLTVSLSQAASLDSYEWWFDNDDSSAQTGTVSGQTFDLEIDTSDLPKGIHYFNLRLAEGDGIYGSIYRRMFHSFGMDNGAISYEYWFDFDYASKVTGNMAVGSNHLDLDISTLPQGIHYFNCRVGYGDGSWGSVYRQMVLNLAGSVDAVAYEYWIDNNYEAKTSGTLTSGANAYEIDMKGVRKGLHRFNYRLQTDEGIWGAPFTSYFYCVSNDERFTEYEYWLDKDYENRVSAKVSTNPVSFEVDLSDFDKSGRAHYFNLRTRDDDGEWSSVYRKLLIFNHGDSIVPMMGYRHFLNDNDLGYVEVERKFTDSYLFDINLPDSVYPRLRNRKPVFLGDTVSFASVDSVRYAMQIRTELGWASPIEWKFDVSNDFSTKAVAMDINSTHTFATPSDREFAAMKFTSEGDELFFHSNVPVGLDIYRDGTRVERFPADSVGKVVGLQLETGNYFGLLYEVQDTLAQNFTFHIMSTPNVVPDPEISFEEGTVSITCIRSDAEIRYTLDGSIPDEESELYVEPFQLKRNATVKAVATVPGSDIATSSVVELIVDSYKVVNPVGTFDVAARLLTLACETKDASILYSQDFNRNDTINARWTVYTEPVKILKNGSLYAKATLDGFNDSDIVEIEIDQLPESIAIPTIDFKEGKVYISCANAEAEIRYTLDGSDPTAESTLYESPFALGRNATIKALAFIPGLDIEPSDIATFIVDTYKVSTPTGSFDAATRLLTIRCSTEGASISYSFSLEDEWSEYTEPISITRNRTVYAKATLDGYNDSETAQITVTELADNVAPPVIAFADGTVTITCANAEAEIRYTLDGSDPTAESTLYESPFALGRNATIKAVAFFPGLDIEPSDIVTFIVDTYKVSTPTGSFDAATRLLTISCATDGASIFYTLDLDSDWLDYTGPVYIHGNRIVYAKATLAGFNDSEIAEITVSEMQCKEVEFSYNGRYMRIDTKENDARILYTTDGTNPSSGMEYDGEFDVAGLCIVRAVAVKDGYLDSDEGTYSIDRYADEQHAETSSEGLLESSLEWSGSSLPNSLESFRVEGRLNDADYRFIAGMQSLRHLDIEKVEAARIPDAAFKGTNLISISLPAEVVEYGDSILADATLISSVMWNCLERPATRLIDGIANPNMLIYLPEGMEADQMSGINVVAGERASSVTLEYGYPYYAHRDFRADSVSMARDFRQSTEIGVCRGWETIVLPFAPQAITHETNGAAVPFAAWDGDQHGMKPFWLYSSTEDGWVAASGIEAGKPYIISMPNNPEYVYSSNLGGKVTFAASGIYLGPEYGVAQSTSWMVGTEFEGTFMPVEEEGILTLNVGDMSGKFLPGSTFVADNPAVPFSAYVSGASGGRAVPIFGDTGSLDLPTAYGDGLLIETPAPGMLRICSSRQSKVAVTTVTGISLRVLSLSPGEAVTIEGLTRDLYIVAGRKVMVR